VGESRELLQGLDADEHPDEHPDEHFDQHSDEHTDPDSDGYADEHSDADGFRADRDANPGPAGDLDACRRTISERSDARGRNARSVRHRARCDRADPDSPALNAWPTPRSETGRTIQAGKGLGHFHHDEYWIGCAYALMKDEKKAMEWLEKAVQDGFPCYPLFQGDRYLDSLRGNAEF
jgi:hypothetical protein